MISALWRLRQDCWEFKSSLDYIAKSYLKKKVRRKEKQVFINMSWHVYTHRHIQTYMHMLTHMCTHSMVYIHKCMCAIHINNIKIYNKIKDVFTIKNNKLKNVYKPVNTGNKTCQRKKTFKKRTIKWKGKQHRKKTDAECTKKKAKMNLHGLVSTICLNGCESLVKIQRLSKWSFKFPSLYSS